MLDRCYAFVCPSEFAEGISSLKVSLRIIAVEFDYFLCFSKRRFKFPGLIAAPYDKDLCPQRKRIEVLGTVHMCKSFVVTADADQQRRIPFVRLSIVRIQLQGFSIEGLGLFKLEPVGHDQGHRCISLAKFPVYLQCPAH